uniref:F-box domain-containing protein n=1 Tax=Sinocyclocheilus grahami TaxID=75366 RepID=A0A672R5X2_SINGR
MYLTNVICKKKKKSNKSCRKKRDSCEGICRASFVIWSPGKRVCKVGARSWTFNGPRGLFRTKLQPITSRTVLPRFLSLYIMSFLSPRDICSAAQVCWHWTFLAEQDCLWSPKCIRLGWFLPYSPSDHEYGAWKRHYVAALKTRRAWLNTSKLGTSFT